MTFDLAGPHLESGGVAADVGGVDETQSEDPYAAAVEHADVTQAAALQVCDLHRLAYHKTDDCYLISYLSPNPKTAGDRPVNRPKRCLTMHVWHCEHEGGFILIVVITLHVTRIKYAGVHYNNNNYNT